MANPNRYNLTNRELLVLMYNEGRSSEVQPFILAVIEAVDLVSNTLELAASPDKMCTAVDAEQMLVSAQRRLNEHLDSHNGSK
jgi:hypothetical protein